jgi:hypothetical protein
LKRPPKWFADFGWYYPNQNDHTNKFIAKNVKRTFHFSPDFIVILQKKSIIKTKKTTVATNLIYILRTITPKKRNKPARHIIFIKS